MILFHLPVIDSGATGLWSRCLVPAYLLRRAGLAVRIVTGEVTAGRVASASAIVIGGAIDGTSIRAAERARAAGMRIVLDVADPRALADLPSAKAVARQSDVLVAGSGTLAEHAAAQLGIGGPVRIIADSFAHDLGLFQVLAAFPGLGSRVLAQALKRRVVDAVRRWRHRLRTGRKAPVGPGPLIVWFGDGSAIDMQGGLGELLLAAADLVDLGQDMPFRLRVIGTARRSFRRTVGRWPIQAEFRRLTLPNLAGDLRDADLCFLPGAGDAQARARSVARAEIARSLGIPVLTAPHGELSARRDLMIETDWPAALRSMLVRRPEAEVPGNAEEQIAGAWQGAVAGDRAASTGPSVPQAGPRRTRVMFLLQQFQDLDLICPVAEAACDAADLDVQVAILTKIAVPATRRLRGLRERGADIRFWHGKELLAGAIAITAGDFDVAVTASDGAGFGARYAAAFVRAANAAGAVTLNLQHGLDNAGLTFGPYLTPQGEPFHAHLVLTWGGLERLSSGVDPATRGKVIPVGCPKRRLNREAAPDFPLAGQRFIAVFENLHWRRYDESFRRRFVQDLIDAALAAPEIPFLLKPHMGGRWFTREQAGRPLPPNLIVADPASSVWRRFTADSFLAHAAGVATTPSTIALDAARYHLPTALVTYGIEAGNYEPLLRIEQAEDWGRFVAQVQTGTCDMTNVGRFHDAAVISGDAAARILDVVRLAAVGQSRAEILAALVRNGERARA